MEVGFVISPYTEAGRMVKIILEWPRKYLFMCLQCVNYMLEKRLKESKGEILQG